MLGAGLGVDVGNPGDRIPIVRAEVRIKSG